MTEAAQNAIVDFLRTSAAYGLSDDTVEQIDTHAARIFLAGTRAYKLKRAVKFPFLDFSSLAMRKDACDKEFALNRRTAPGLYQGVLPVNQSSTGALSIDGPGEPVDWLVCMNRFDQNSLLDNLARREGLTATTLRDLADRIASFHQSADRQPDFGGATSMMEIASNDLSVMRDNAAGVVSESVCQQLETAWTAAIRTHGSLLDQRRSTGMVRHCHGDLHLRNICLLDGKPTLFDCIEFNDTIACVDVLYDLAFLLMDLIYRGDLAGANLVMNRYLARTQDYAGVALLPIFQSLRAGVRAMVSAVESVDAKGENATALAKEANQYAQLALDLLVPRPTSTVAVGGLSGSGKSALAASLAPLIGRPPGAVVLRSDVIRKTLAGKDPETKLSARHYAFQENQKVYARMGATAGIILEAGQSVLFDAVFSRQEERAMAARIADNARCVLCGLWLEAPMDTLLDRLARRSDDASDADAAVLELQLKQDIGELDWTRIASGGSMAETLNSVKNALPPGALSTTKEG